MWLTSSATFNDIDCAWNLFENCSVVSATRGVVLTRKMECPTKPTTSVNSAHNTFVGLSVQYLGQNADSELDVLAAGVHLVECDNNSFYRTWTFRDETTGTMGHGVRIEDPSKARANYFCHLQGRVFVKKANAGLNANHSKNLIFGYDRDNGQLEPFAKTDLNVDADPGEFLFWVDSRGAGTAPILIEGQQETGYCCAGGLAAVDAAVGSGWAVEAPVNFKTVMSHEPTALDMTVIGAFNVLAIAIKWADGSQSAAWTGPFTARFDSAKPAKQ